MERMKENLAVDNEVALDHTDNVDSIGMYYSIFTRQVILLTLSEQRWWTLPQVTYCFLHASESMLRKEDLGTMY